MFGGGEPLAFKGFATLVRRLFDETALAVSLTTNGTLLSETMAAALAPCTGQIRVSIYDDIDARPTIALLELRTSHGMDALRTLTRLASPVATLAGALMKGDAAYRA